jgi:hypothetical protein
MVYAFEEDLLKTEEDEANVRRDVLPVAGPFRCLLAFSRHYGKQQMETPLIFPQNVCCCLLSIEILLLNTLRYRCHHRARVPLLYMSIPAQVLVHCLISRQRRMLGLQRRDRLGAGCGIEPSVSPLIISRLKWETLVKVICILYKIQSVPRSKHTVSQL